jgi:hypothetical protein
MHAETSFSMHLLDPIKLYRNRNPVTGTPLQGPRYRDPVASPVAVILGR